MHWLIDGLDIGGHGFFYEGGEFLPPPPWTSSGGVGKDYDLNFFLRGEQGRRGGGGKFSNKWGFHIKVDF